MYEVCVILIYTQNISVDHIWNIKVMLDGFKYWHTK